jgi:hypothetical protein
MHRQRYISNTYHPTISCRISADAPKVAQRPGIHFSHNGFIALRVRSLPQRDKSIRPSTAVSPIATDTTGVRHHQLVTHRRWLHDNAGRGVSWATIHSGELTFSGTNQQADRPHPLAIHRCTVADSLIDRKASREAPHATSRIEFRRRLSLMRKWERAHCEATKTQRRYRSNAEFQQFTRQLRQAQPRSWYMDPHRW